MNRVLAATILLCGCGHKSDRQQPKPADALDAAPAQKLPEPAGPPLTAPHGPTPAAAVIIGADGGLRVALAGSWDRVTAPGFRDQAVEVPSLDVLAPSLLEVMGQAPDAELAQLAREMKAELEQAGPPADEPGDAEEVAFTYLAPVDDELSPVTPLVIADPAAPGRRLSEVLDKVGGVVALAKPDGLAVLRLAAPWDHLEYGGVDIDDDRPSYDVQVGRERVDISVEWDPGSGGGSGTPIGAAIRDRVSSLPAAPGPSATVDLMVADTATADSLVQTIAAFDAAGTGTIGVGLSPWPYTW